MLSAFSELAARLKQQALDPEYQRKVRQERQGLLELIHDQASNPEKYRKIREQEQQQQQEKIDGDNKLNSDIHYNRFTADMYNDLARTDMVPETLTSNNLTTRIQTLLDTIKSQQIDINNYERRIGNCNERVNELENGVQNYINNS